MAGSTNTLASPVIVFAGVGDGVTDDTPALNAAMATLANGRGGTILFDAKTYLFASTIRPPYVDDATYPQMKPLKFQGSGPHWSGSSSGITPGGTPIIGGTTFDMRGGNAYGKIQLRGLGVFAADGITFTNLGTPDVYPMIYTTNTTLILTHNCFLGSSTLSGVSCNQDAIVMGGTTAVISNAETAAFQGYGTVIDTNYFDHIQRAVYGRVYCNSSVIRNNTVWIESGSNLAGGACIEINGYSGASDYAEGNVIDGNLIEMYHYTYAISLVWAKQNVVVGNSGWDGSAQNNAVVYCENSAYQNYIYGAVSPPSIPYFLEPAVGTNGNTYIGTDTSAKNGNSYFGEMGTTIFTGPIGTWSTTVAALGAWGTKAPTDSIAFASNGRKSGEGAGLGTGCPVWYDGTNWRTFYDNSIAAA